MADSYSGLVERAKTMNAGELLDAIGHFFCGSRLRATSCLSALLLVAGVWALWPTPPPPIPSPDRSAILSQNANIPAPDLSSFESKRISDSQENKVDDWQQNDNFDINKNRIPGALTADEEEKEDKTEPGFPGTEDVDEDGNLMGPPQIGKPIQPDDEGTTTTEAEASLPIKKEKKKPKYSDTGILLEDEEDEAEDPTTTKSSILEKKKPKYSDTGILLEEEEEGQEEEEKMTTKKVSDEEEKDMKETAGSHSKVMREEDKVTTTTEASLLPPQEELKDVETVEKKEASPEDPTTPSDSESEKLEALDESVKDSSVLGDTKVSVDKEELIKEEAEEQKSSRIGEKKYGEELEENKTTEVDASQHFSDKKEEGLVPPSKVSIPEEKEDDSKLSEDAAPPPVLPEDPSESETSVRKDKRPSLSDVIQPKTGNKAETFKGTEFESPTKMTDEKEPESSFVKDSEFGSSDKF